MTQTSGRYLSQQKGDDEQFRRALRAFARGLTPHEAKSYKANSHRPNLSVNTLYNFYDLLRKRLCAVCYFLPPPSLAQAIVHEDEHYIIGLRDRDRLGLAHALVGQRRGVSKESQGYHLAELYHRLRVKQTEQDFIYDIETLVKITGPLNKKPIQTEKADEFIRHRMYMRHLRQLRQIRNDTPERESTHRELIGSVLKAIG